MQRPRDSGGLDGGRERITRMVIHSSVSFPGSCGWGTCYRAMGLLLLVASRNEKLRHGDFSLPGLQPPGLGALASILPAAPIRPEPQVCAEKGCMHLWP